MIWSQAIQRRDLAKRNIGSGFGVRPFQVESRSEMLNIMFAARRDLSCGCSKVYSFMMRIKGVSYRAAVELPRDITLAVCDSGRKC